VKITSVQYGRLVNLGNYENEKLSAWATVEDDETPDEALAKVTAFIEEQAGTRKQQESQLEVTAARLSRMESEKRQMEREIREMRETWTKARAFLTTIGLELPRSYVQDTDDDGMPF